MMPIQTELHKKLSHGLKPEHLELTNESPMHGLPATAEKHFRVLVVSQSFKGQSRTDRHRLVHRLVEHELKSHIHALAVQAYTPEEWNEKQVMQGKGFDSPACLGGGKRERGDDGSSDGL